MVVLISGLLVVLFRSRVVIMRLVIVNELDWVRVKRSSVSGNTSAGRWVMKLVMRK